MSEIVFTIRGLNKHFGPTHANKNVDLDLKKGEIRGLIGENGSGKSTLISQIAGIYPSDSGEMTINGEPYVPTDPLYAYKHKISMVLQELGVVGNLSVAANVFLGRTKQFAKAGFVNLKKMNRAAAEVFKKWDIPMPPLGGNVGKMLIEERKMVELARALSIEPNILLLDEITQSLSMNNREKLYDILKKIKELGRSVILITHDVEEMLRITDNITVLRDGEVVGTVVSSETDPDTVKHMMVGREMEGDYYRSDRSAEYDDTVVLKVDNISVPGEIEDITFDVHAGEIIGLCGLSDSGIHSVGKALYGLSKISKGSITLCESGKTIRTPMQALGSRMGYVPKDRDSEAMMINDSVRENFSLPSMTELSGPVGYISPKKMNELASRMVDQLSVKCTGILQPVNALSGGNKQKINLGRWLAKDLKVLILDCPTRGVDVGVKAYIYSLMKEAKKEKIAIVLISDELTEVIGMADRLIVMKDGKMTRVISRDGDFTEQAIIEVMI
ncbi:MAG: sugar ABC transporter ATP-binding protein [Lachnospiraceae bacterium]|jgi:ribose transport system ATP-binding protein